jgi:tRNA-dihydrouridine synthase
MLGETGCAAVMFARGAMGNPFIFAAARALLETGEFPLRDGPGERALFSARIKTALRHLELLAADIGEREACLEMRKQFCAYTRIRGGSEKQGGRGISGGAALRNALVHAETIADYRRIASEYSQFIY